jgi:hypothetical protein
MILHADSDITIMGKKRIAKRGEEHNGVMEGVG